MELIDIPTGKIIVNDYEKGKLETLTIGDYGKERNIKADFLGFTKEINGVANGECKKLSEKWVITLSTQYGCSMSCNFCDAPNIKFGGNASVKDLKDQLMNAISVTRAETKITYTDRLNIHFARMGEPSLNSENVFNFSRWLADKYSFQKETGLRVETIHPVFTTMMPNAASGGILAEWANIKNNLFNGQAGLQISINSTSNQQRNVMFNKRAMSLSLISAEGRKLPDPLGRKYCLNFAVHDDTIIDAFLLKELFPPERFMVKITPIHNNNACKKNGIETTGGYSEYASYKEHENRLKDAGFDVLVFVPSMDEEDGCVTCGNAILGGSKIKDPATAPNTKCTLPDPEEIAPVTFKEEIRESIGFKHGDIIKCTSVKANGNQLRPQLTMGALYKVHSPESPRPSLRKLAYVRNDINHHRPYDQGRFELWDGIAEDVTKTDPPMLHKFGIGSTVVWNAEMRLSSINKEKFAVIPEEHFVVMGEFADWVTVMVRSNPYNPELPEARIKYPSELFLKP